jgi:thiol-disulfide isomerase/thioredoxin
MAPAFVLTTLSGEQFSLDKLEGKVILVDFWATWCGPCREALPHMQTIAKKFAGQPLVILSISLDNDQTRWQSFVAKNNMTWQQYRDGGFDGVMAQRSVCAPYPPPSPSMLTACCKTSMWVTRRSKAS